MISLWCKKGVGCGGNCTRPDESPLCHSIIILYSETGSPKLVLREIDNSLGTMTLRNPVGGGTGWISLLVPVQLETIEDTGWFLFRWISYFCSVVSLIL